MKDDPPDRGPHRVAMDKWIDRAPFEKLLHMDIVEAAGGRALLTMPFLFDFAQGAGLMHGGALVGLADTAVAMAIKSLLPPGTHFATITLEARYLRPVKQGVVTARASVHETGERRLDGEAILYDGENHEVMQFKAAFKVARDGRIRPA